MTVKKATSLGGPQMYQELSDGQNSKEIQLYLKQLLMKASQCVWFYHVTGNDRCIRSCHIYGALTVQESSTLKNQGRAATITNNLTLKSGLVSAPMGGTAKTLTSAKLGYLSTIESDLQTQLNNLKFTTNKRMYVNDQTVQTAEYTLTIGSDTLDYKYTPNVFALSNVVPYRDSAGQDITFRIKKN